MQGWIKIHRQLQDKAYINKPAYVSLWVNLLLLANHKEREVMWNGQIKTIGRGQFITGRKELSKLTGIPETTIERILKVFESGHQIEQQKTTKYRLITILNWDKHQGVDNKRTTNGQQTDTNKNERSKEDISEQSSVTNNLEDMAWKKYNENEHNDEETTIDAETGDFMENEEEKLAEQTRKDNAEMRKYIKGLRDSLNLPGLEPKQMNWQLKDYRILLARGWSHKNIGEAFIHIATSDLWKEKMQNGEYPGMNTVEFSLRNKSPK